MSNLVVKMMSGENLADSNQSKGFTLVEAYGEVRCVRDLEGKPRIEIPLECGQVAMYHPEGNTYLLKNGKTAATFSYSLQSDAHVALISQMRQISKDYNHYSSNANIIMTYKDFVETVFDKRYVMILEDVLPEIQKSGEFIGRGLSEFVTKVLNIDASATFHVYGNEHNLPMQVKL